MSLWGFIKSLLGFGEEEEGPPVYNPPFIVIPGAQNRQAGNHWDQMRERWNTRMEWEREKRSRYGG